MRVFKSQFNPLISQLKQLKDDDGLNPLRQDVLQQQLMVRLIEVNKNINLPKKYLWARYRFNYVYVLTAVFLVVMMTGGTVMAAKGSLPGDTLYPVKRLAEQVEVTLAPSTQAKANIEASHATERLDELSGLQQKALGQPDENNRVRFEQREDEARQTTEKEVETALNVLRDLQVKFATSGKNQDASVLNNALEQLTKKANESEFEVRYENEQGRYKVKNNRSRKSENYNNETGANSSENNSVNNGNSPVDVRENSGDVWCLGEWRDPAECKDQALPTSNTNEILPTTPLPNTNNNSSSLDNSATPSDESIINTDVRENNDEVFCRGEWRDPADCDR